MAAIEYSSQARKWLERAEPDVQEQVLDRLERAADFPDHFLIRLTNSHFYEPRAGDYRAIVDWRREEGILFVRRIGHRRNVYKQERKTFVGGGASPDGTVARSARYTPIDRP